jgi:Prokaryotic phospholipase A2
MKAKHDKLTEALTGRFDAYHGELARMLLDHACSHARLYYACERHDFGYRNYKKQHRFTLTKQARDRLQLLYRYERCLRYRSE